MVALHLKPWTPQRLVSRDEYQRPSGTVAGSHIADMVHLKQAICLCHKCQHKFAATKAGYVTRSNLPFVGGRCDGCNEMGFERRLYLHHKNLPQ